jgi:PPOX class probable FMN-dependent enzyme
LTGGCAARTIELVPDDPHRITSTAEIDALLGEPGELVRSKKIRRLDDHCRALLARSPLALLGTTSADGRVEVSPRGGACGFARASDDGARLEFGDAKGNRLAESSRNIVATGRVALLFLVPGYGETLRVAGRAHLSRDPEVLARTAGGGRPSPLAVVVEVEAAHLHCAAALHRSRLWQPDTWPDVTGLPTSARIWRDHAALDDPLDDLEAGIAEYYATGLDW